VTYTIPKWGEPWDRCDADLAQPVRIAAFYLDLFDTSAPPPRISPSPEGGFPAGEIEPNIALQQCRAHLRAAAGGLALRMSPARAAAWWRLLRFLRTAAVISSF